MNDTRENLVRVDDIVRELSANLEKLQTQAEVARRFQALQTDQNEKQMLLWLLRKNEANTEQIKFFAQIDQAQTMLEANTASLRSIEASVETLRQSHYDAGDLVHQAQGRLYQTNAEVGSLEVQIKFVNESRVRLQAQLDSLTSQRDHWLGQGAKHAEDLTDAETAAIEQAMRAAEAAEVVAQHQERMPALEQTWRDAQLKAGEERTKILHARQQLELEATRQRNVGQILAGLKARRDRLTLERGGMQLPDQFHFANLKTQLEEKQAVIESSKQALESLQARQQSLEQRSRDASIQATKEATSHAQLDARLSALTQLQESVQAQGKLHPWLRAHALQDLPKLWERVQIAPGWETAVESVLRERTAALELPNIQSIATLSESAPPSKLAVFVTDAYSSVATDVAAPGSSSDLRSLFSLLQLHDSSVRSLLQEWLRSIYIAENLSQALLQREKLPNGAYFVTKEGHLIGLRSVYFYAPDTAQDGMLARKNEIDHLSKQVRVQQMLAEEANSAGRQAEEALRTTVQQLQDLGFQLSAATQAAHALQLDVMKMSDQASRVEQRFAQIDQELLEIRFQEGEQQMARAEHEARYEELEAILAALLEADASGQGNYLEHEDRLNDARTRLRELERAAQEAAFAEKSHGNRIAELKRSIATAKEQATQLSANLDRGSAEYASLDDEAAISTLQNLLGSRVEQEAALSDARHRLDQLAQNLRQQEDARSKAEHSLQPQRDQIMELQLKEQAARLNQEQYAQQLAEAQVDEATLHAKLTPGMRPAYLQGEVTRLAAAILALGAVNLAALDELDQASERKNFLDAQTADLTSAINTLQDAIHKIDHETRDLLQDTFDKVNQHFSELFPILFGGGNAKLIMTGEEILDAGVQVMAQPPGKKNATIHLLSGGEKALTATALVFSMFQLNPAPFCLLDEVDAPLDDANTERFCNMVKRMAEQTQFLFISHNKIAMEMAHQLIGVTMQEQGVSRIVAVDMEAARHFAAEPAIA